MTLIPTAVGLLLQVNIKGRWYKTSTFHASKQVLNTENTENH
jgi:hypothetical protein